MSGRRLMDLPVAKFDGESIDNVFFVKFINTPEMQRVEFKDVFEWIKKEAIKSGLTVELKEDRIIFIKNGE